MEFLGEQIFYHYVCGAEDFAQGFVFSTAEKHPCLESEQLPSIGGKRESGTEVEREEQKARKKLVAPRKGTG